MRIVTSIASTDHCAAVQLDLSRGVLAAVPGWAHVRLLAPHADLRLLVCGHSTLVDSHRLRCRLLSSWQDCSSGTRHGLQTVIPGCWMFVGNTLIPTLCSMNKRAAILTS